MCRAKPVFGNLLLILLAAALASAADDVQVIRSSKTVLSIYSYGAPSQTGVAPELSERQHRKKQSTAPLTDVVATPRLSKRDFGREPNTSGSGRTGRHPPATTSSSLPAKTSSSTGSPRIATTSSGQVTSGAPTITLAWDPSPDGAVVGYRVYSGSATHRYTQQQTLGDQTSTELPLADGAIYLVVTAYNADGLESVPSEELVIITAAQQNASAIGGGEATATAR